MGLGRQREYTQKWKHVWRQSGVSHTPWLRYAQTSKSRVCRILSLWCLLGSHWPISLRSALPLAVSSFPTLLLRVMSLSLSLLWSIHAVCRAPSLCCSRRRRRSSPTEAAAVCSKQHNTHADTHTLILVDGRRRIISVHRTNKQHLTER